MKRNKSRSKGWFLYHRLDYGSAEEFIQFRSDQEFLEGNSKTVSLKLASASV